MKCGRIPDQHDRTASAGQTEESQSQVTYRNAERATSVVAVEEMEEAVPESSAFSHCPRESSTAGKSTKTSRKPQEDQVANGKKTKRSGAGLTAI